ncbi:exotoxin beta-grasp domain-containing protein (plasmid) [Clostridium perfringens]|uniref:Mitogenic protein n=1 Tax=Clostridium perfringens TaxID=1502 RepID=A0A126G9S3_CLOPF|nr:exotoxin beta-grasp domain-containing protein [Clostridium perfringens]ALD82554.1 mitogenic protein [Clostridium perfringens]
MLKKVLIFICVVIVITNFILVNANAESFGRIENSPWQHKSWVIHSEIYDGVKIKRIVAGSIYLDTNKKASYGTNRVIKVELRSGLYHHKFKEGDFVDFYGGSRDGGGYICDCEEVIFKEGGITALPRTKVDKQIQANVLDKKGNHPIINHSLLKFPYKEVSIQEIDLRIRKLLIEKENWYKDGSTVKGKIGIHFKDGSERFIYLNQLYDYRTNEHIDVTDISHFDLYLGEKYIE